MIIINLFSEENWLLLDRIGIFMGDILMILSLAGAIYGFITRNKFRNWLFRNQFPSIGGSLEHTQWQGLVFTLSRTEVPLWVIGQVQPQQIGLLVSQPMQAVADEIRRTAELQNITVICETLNDPDDPAETKQKTKLLLQTMQAQCDGDLAVDVTGGKTTMSLGAFMAAEELGHDSIYVTVDYANGRPDITTAKIKALSQAST